MGQKDIAEKTLEAYNDVFADIMNGVVFKGERIVKEEDLQETATASAFNTGKKLHGQDRDVSKYWQENNVRIAMCGIENQTVIDYSMPLRVIAYDGASYKKQIIDKRKKSKDNIEEIDVRPKFFPVITLVIYMGDKPWNKNTTLHEVLNIKPELKPFVNDYKAHIVDLSSLKKKDIERFNSDFRSLIDWIKKKKDPAYEVKDRVWDHPLEMRQLFYELSNDKRVWEAYTDEEAAEGERITMCEFIDRLEEEGRIKGKAEGRAEGKIELLADLIEDGTLSIKQAADKMSMTVAKFKSTAKKLGICL